MACPRVGWRAWTAYGFLAAALIETIKGVLLLARVGVLRRRGREHGRDTPGPVLSLPIRRMLRQG
jgi:hypothetical protein